MGRVGAGVLCLALVYGVALLGSVDGVVITGEFSASDLPVKWLDTFVFDTYPRQAAEGVLAGTFPDSRAALLKLNKTSGTDLQALVIYNDDTDFTLLQQRVADGSIDCATLVAAAPFTEILQGRSAVRRVVWQETRPRVWFVGLVMCDPDEETVAALDSAPYKFNLTMVNPGGTYFKRHFSADEQGTPQVNFISATAMAAVFCVAVYSAASKFKHATMASAYRVLTVAVFFQLTSLMCKTIHQLRFAVDGQGSPVLMTASNLAGNAYSLTFMMLLVNMMKGWNTSYQSVSQNTKVFNVVLGILLVTAYCLVALWGLLFGTPASVLFLYNSPPGLAILGLRSIMTAWFCYATLKRLDTTKHKKKKNDFFTKFGLWGLCYFLSLPVVVLIAAFLNAWSQTRITVIIDAVVNIVAVIGTMLLLDPSRLDDTFVGIKTTIVVGSRRHVESKSAPTDEPPTRTNDRTRNSDSRNQVIATQEPTSTAIAIDAEETRAASATHGDSRPSSPPTSRPQSVVSAASSSGRPRRVDPEFTDDERRKREEQKIREMRALRAAGHTTRWKPKRQKHRKTAPVTKPVDDADLSDDHSDDGLRTAAKPAFASATSPMVPGSMGVAAMASSGAGSGMYVSPSVSQYAGMGASGRMRDTAGSTFSQTGATPSRPTKGNGNGLFGSDSESDGEGHGWGKPSLGRGGV